MTKMSEGKDYVDARDTAEKASGFPRVLAAESPRVVQRAMY